MKNHQSHEAISDIYHQPLLDLVFKAATVHREHHRANEVQVSSLVSIKTGACPEDCAYCAQSARFKTAINVEKLMPLTTVLDKARAAKAGGASRLCMGAAWRNVKDNQDFERVLEMVSAVNDLGLEVCCTLGMLTAEQAEKLAQAGLYAYNHNLDTSRDFYPKIITTRTYDDRLATIEHVRKAGITVCSGGIIGLGETPDDRISMLGTLANLPTPPESVPINALVPIAGTPLGEQSKVDGWEMLRMVATARILMPKTVVRLAAGRHAMSTALQAFCFLAGANSIFAGDKLLTTPNPDFKDDAQLFTLLGLLPKPVSGQPSEQDSEQNSGQASAVCRPSP